MSVAEPTLEPMARAGQDGDAAARHVVAESSAGDERTRVLKHGDTFAVFDHRGDILPGGLGEQGLYHEGARHLSRLSLELDGGRAFHLGSTVRDDNDQLAVALTNPDLVRDGRLVTPLGTLQLAMQTFLWRGACYQRMRVKNHGIETVQTCLGLHFAADYADIYEVRGMKRRARGADRRPQVSADRVVLGYRGLDRIFRRTTLAFDPAPALLTGSEARFDLTLPPQAEATITVTIACDRRATPSLALCFDHASAEAEQHAALESAGACRLRTSNGQVDAWINRAVSDLHMLTTELPTGPYPYAGVPWFNTPFGRDGLITALESLWLRPSLARGVLAYLAATQTTEVIADQDAEPGKILHETRNGEMATLKEMPYARYYGSVDATPLFVILAGAYFERTGDGVFAEHLWPHVCAALAWIEKYGDADGDGFVEYLRQSVDGLVHQGWKDSDDAIFHADGRLAHGPIALSEVQGYVYAAWKAGAALAAAIGHPRQASAWSRKAATLRKRFARAFWCKELSTYALALDAYKQRCEVRTSNAGHCLFTGIASPEHAARVARTLLAPESFSGWGVRTLGSREARYNPMSYHSGSIWPHDNAIVAAGLARYGFGEQTLQIWTAIFEASTAFDLHRMPELYCGFPRTPGEGPVIYPVACAPQAWSAASVFLLFQACLGLEVRGAEKRVYLRRPRLPAAIDELRIEGLELGGAMVDLRLIRHDRDVGVIVSARDGEIEVLVVK